jgi:hypothetical protein
MGDFACGSGGIAEGGRLELRPVAAGRLGRRFAVPLAGAHGLRLSGGHAGAASGVAKSLGTRTRL